MKILYIGDIMGRIGREMLAETLPGLIEEKAIDFVVAQSENVSHGKGMLPKHMAELKACGVDFFSGGNHSFKRPQLLSALENPIEPVIGPANATGDYPGLGWKIAETELGKVLVVTLLGSVFPPDLEISSPLKRIDEILEETKDEQLVARVVNIHSDYSSEKVMMGNHLDGRVDLVVGDHWHVPTADARMLPKGTAHITDVGMCGTLDSSLGIEFEVTIPRWYDGQKTKQVMAEALPWQFNAVLADTDKKTIEQIRIIKS